VRRKSSIYPAAIIRPYIESVLTKKLIFINLFFISLNGVNTNTLPNIQLYFIVVNI